MLTFVYFFQLDMDPNIFHNVRNRTIAIYGLPRYATIVSVLRYLDQSVFKDLKILNNRFVKGIVLERGDEYSRAYINLASRMFWTYAEERADKIANGVYAFSVFAEDDIKRLSLRMTTPPECNWILSYELEKTKGIVKTFEIADSPPSIYDCYSYVWGLMKMSNVPMRSSGEDLMADVSSICMRRSTVLISILDGQVSRTVERYYEKFLGNSLKTSSISPSLEFRFSPLSEIREMIQERKSHLESMSQFSFTAFDVKRKVMKIQNGEGTQERMIVETNFQRNEREDQQVLNVDCFSPLSPDHHMIASPLHGYDSDSTAVYSVINGPLSDTEY